MPDPTRIPDWQLERHLLNELPPEEEAAVRAALDLSPSERLRLQALDESSRELFDAHPPQQVAALVRARLAAVAPAEASPETRSRWIGWRPALAAAAAVVVTSVALWTAAPRWIGTSGATETRIKGLKPQLTLYRQTTSGIEQLGPGSVAHRDDVVQILYQAAGKQYGAILSIDGRGVLTRHLPERGARAARLQTNQLVPLPSAYRLDDAPRFECFYLVAADRPFEVATVIEAVKKPTAAPSDGVEAPRRLDLPEGMDQYVFVLAKEGSR